MGRRTKLTPEVQDRILQAVRAGLRYREAALAAGIDERTFYNWKRRGEEAKSGIYFQFFQSLKEAEARGELALLARIQAASQETWQAAAWILERRHRERWGRNNEAVRVQAAFGADAVKQMSVGAGEFDDGSIANILVVLAETGALESATAEDSDAEDDEVHST